MHISEVKIQEGTLRKLKNLLDNKDRKVHGVFYTNDFFSERYLCRYNVLGSQVNFSENSIDLTLETRVEQAGITELENTKNILTQYEMGDVTSFIPEGFLDQENGEDNENTPKIPEPVSVNQFLYGANIYLIMNRPEIFYQEFKIAGETFTLVNIRSVVAEFFTQTVSVLFGNSDKMNFFSHFYNKKLGVRDLKKVLELIVDENITGKAITGVRLESGIGGQGISSTIYPIEELFGTYMNIDGDYIFNVTTSYVTIPKDELPNLFMVCKPNTTTGSYAVTLSNPDEKYSLTVYTE